MIGLSCLGGASFAAPDAGSPWRPRIGLVLSGGGARGGAHLGVLKVLQEQRVPIDLIVGTSAGAIIGAAYASGMTLPEIEAEVEPLGTALLFRDVARGDRPLRSKENDAVNFVGPEVGISSNGLALPKGAVSGVSLEAVLRRLTVKQREGDFDRLPIPFRAIATDLTTAEMVVLDHGNLAKAVRASMALPAIVNPVEIDGRLLIDGGVSRNLPVDVARRLGADIVIAVNIGTPMLQRDELVSLLSVSNQMVRILTHKNVTQSLAELKPGDVLITPDLGTIETGDFDRALEAAAAGESAARAAAAQLKLLSMPEDAYAALQAQRRVEPMPVTAVVDEVRVEGNRRVNADAVLGAMQTRAGEPFDEAKADADMRRIFSSGDFEHVDYHLIDRPEGGHALVTDVVEKAWGPNYLRTGLSLSSDFSGNSNFNLLLSHRATWMNRLGAQWRNDLQIGRVDRLRSEWHQPLSARQGLFVDTHGELRREPFDLYVPGRRIARFSREEAMLGSDVGISISNTAELKAGVRRGRVRLGTDTGLIAGSQLIPATNVGGLALRVHMDTLDSLHFPRSGALVDVNYLQTVDWLGTKDQYRKVQVALQGAASWDANSLRAAVFGSQPMGGGDLPGYELAQLGGFLRLSGYHSGEFIGTKMVMGRLVYTRRISAPGLLDGIYLGASAEAGRINESSIAEARGVLRSNALFLAADTPLGPVYLAYGRAKSGRSAAYFYLGLP